MRPPGARRGGEGDRRVVRRAGRLTVLLILSVFVNSVLHSWIILRRNFHVRCLFILKIADDLQPQKCFHSVNSSIKILKLVDTNMPEDIIVIN